MMVVPEDEKAKVRIAIDSHEPDEICDSLEALGAEIEIRTLEVGDYQLSDRLIAERKTRSDFESSILDGRLFHQLSQTSAAFPRAVIIVEGDAPSDSRISRSALLGAYSSIIADFGCALFFTRSTSATAEMLFALAKHEQIGKKQLLSVYAKRKARTFPEQQRAIIESLPNIGPTLARSLLNYFNTVENVISAPESELAEVGKIGKKKAHELRELLSKSYKEE